MKRKALFVGVDEYDDPQIRNLRFSRIDAHSLNDLFADVGYDVKYLPNPTKAEVLAAVRERTNGLAAGDSFFFYFAGHGFTQGGHDLLFCRDDVYEDLRFDDAGLKFEKLRQRTETGSGYDCVFVLDACRSDFLTGTRGTATYARDLAPAKNLVKDAAPKTGSLAVLRSCSPYQYALEVESKQHGLFTCAFLDVMRTARREGTRLAFDESFGDAVAKTMTAIARNAHLTAEQTPDFAKSAGCAAQVLIEGRTAPPPAAAPVYVACPKCGVYKAITETFRCRICGIDHLCLSHYSKEHTCCDACASKTEPKPGDEMTIALPGGVPMTFCWCPATTCVQNEGHAVHKDDIAIARDHVFVRNAMGAVIALNSKGSLLSSYEGTLTASWRDIRSVAAGFDHVVGLTSQGELVSTGNTKEFSGSSTIRSWRNIVMVDACEGHVAAVMRDGRIEIATETWGYEVPVNYSKELREIRNAKKAAVGWLHAAILLTDGTVRIVGECDHVKQCDGWKDVIDIDVFGCYYSPTQTVGLTSSGRVLHSLDDDEPDSWHEIVSVSCGNQFIVGLDKNGLVFACGRNDQGQCDVADWPKMICAKGDFFRTVAIDTDGWIWMTPVGKTQYNIFR